MKDAFADIEAPVLDRDVLDHYTMSNPALQRELFRLFIDQSSEYLAALQEALESGNRDDWKMTAHGVKGAARSLGLIRLGLQAETAEKTGPTERALDVFREAFTDIEKVLPLSDAA